MVAVNCALKQEEVKTVVEGLGYSFVEKKGLKLIFDNKDVAVVDAVAKVKSAIKAAPFGTYLYYSVEGV